MANLINIDVPDLARGIQFYTQAVEMKLLRILDGDVAELSRDGDKFYLSLKGDNSQAVDLDDRHKIARSYSRHWTPVHVDFVVQDLEAAKRNAIAAGATCESECIEWRGSRCITFSDPFGHGFCLIEFSDKTYSGQEEDQADVNPRTLKNQPASWNDRTS
jgi:predicted enzyme related to lactoylglutathione lyase